MDFLVTFVDAAGAKYPKEFYLTRTKISVHGYSVKVLRHPGSFLVSFVYNTIRVQK